jgi:hypothetical protein
MRSFVLIIEKDETVFSNHGFYKENEDLIVFPMHEFIVVGVVGLSGCTSSNTTTTTKNTSQPTYSAPIKTPTSANIASSNYDTNTLGFNIKVDSLKTQ